MNKKQFAKRMKGTRKTPGWLVQTSKYFGQSSYLDGTSLRDIKEDFVTKITLGSTFAF